MKNSRNNSFVPVLFLENKEVNKIGIPPDKPLQNPIPEANPIRTPDEITRLRFNWREGRVFTSTELLAEKAEYFTDKHFTLLLEDLQANILRHHRKNKALFAFLRFDDFKEEDAGSGKGALKQWLFETGCSLTRAIDQLSNPALKQITCFYLSYAGYAYLDMKWPEAESLSFEQGLMKRTVFGNEQSGIDIDIEPAFNERIDALLLIAGDNLNVKQEKRKLEKRIKGFATVVKTETGTLNLPNARDKRPREWFGFRDDISNPRFFPGQRDRNRPDYEEPAALDVLLRSCSGPTIDACGSFLVFMKLEQHVDAFNDSCRELAMRLYKVENPSQEQIDYAGALLVGRHKDGTPLTLSPTPDPNIVTNVFDYFQDEEGLKCPFHAHIRKANPRKSSDYHRMLRRGMLYGDTEQEGGQKGILFMSFQNNLERQFEDTVNRWMFRSYSENMETGQDSLLSNNSKYRHFSSAWGKNNPPVYLPRKKFITFKGGLYFFAPSISYVKITLGTHW